jgi:hypothetical protein
MALKQPSPSAACGRVQHLTGVQLSVAGRSVYCHALAAPLSGGESLLRSTSASANIR